jgi:hypothetical protein
MTNQIEILQEEYTSNGVYVNFGHNQKFGYHIAQATNVLAKNLSFDLAKIVIDLLPLYDYKDALTVVKYARVEYNRVSKTDKYFHNSVSGNVMRRLDGLRPVNTGKVEKWVKV